MSWAMWWIKASARRADELSLAPEREEEDFLTQLEREEELPEEKRTAPGRPSVMASWRIDEPRGGERVERNAELR